MQRPPPRIGAFFDVDKTIICENSGSLYLRALYDRGEVDFWTVARSLGPYLQYKMNLLDVERWVQATMSSFAGRAEKEITEEAEQWFVEYVIPTIYPEARELVTKHMDAGHVVALVSGSTKFVIKPLARHLGVPHMMHTHLETKDGLFTGRVLQPICLGEGKIYWVQQLIEAEGIDLAKSYFYTDSITDRPLLDLVGHPQIVNPDPLLYRVAKRRHWPVRFFTDPFANEGGS